MKEKYSGIVPLSQSGTNSTKFTRCCEVAICDDEPNCPKCGAHIIGYDAETSEERRRIRWEAATAHWKRN